MLRGIRQAAALAALLSLCCIILGACSDKAAAPVSIEGRWRMELGSPGGPLPFFVRVMPPGSSPAAVIENGEAEDPITSMKQTGSDIEFRFAVYDAQIKAVLSADGQTMKGSWYKTTPTGQSELPMQAERLIGAKQVSRFLPAAASQGGSLAGRWKTTFRDEDESFVAMGEFQQRGKKVRGTFLTATGDYRFLDGDFDGKDLRLSTFDGSDAFLFRAQLKGEMLVGDFWSDKSYHATFTATRHAGDADEILPDPYSEVSITSKDGKLRFSFPDLSGKVVTNEDPRFRGKVLLVDIFGSWCPNCNDIAPILAEWHSRYGKEGLEVVGLAFEFTGDPVRDRKVLAKYKEKYEIKFPLLLAGVSDKKTAARKLPDLSELKSYPTTIFVARDGRVRKIHSGFAGPGTGKHHALLVAEMESIIKELLAENQNSEAGTPTCEADNAASSYAHGMRIRSKDANAAAAEFEKGCNCGHQESCLMFASHLESGSGVMQDPARARKILVQACTEGVRRGCLVSGQRFLYQAKPDLVQGLPLIRKACGENILTGAPAVGLEDPNANLARNMACEILAAAYENSRFGFERDYARAHALFQATCELESPRGCAQVGFFHRQGMGVAKDYATAMDFFERACAADDDMGCYHLGQMYATGQGVAVDVHKARPYLQRACDKGVFEEACGLLKQLKAD